MATEITQGGLQWKASIDYSSLEVDADNIEKILARLGGSVIDVGQVSTDMKKVQDVIAQSVQASAQKMQTENEKAITTVIQQTKQIQDELAKEAQPIFVTPETVGEEKKLMEEIVSNAKKDYEELIAYQKDLREQGFNGPVSQRQGTNKKGGSEDVQAVLSDSLQSAIAQAENAYQRLDDETRAYIDELIDLETQLQKNKKAQQELDKASADGKVSAGEYSAAIAALTGEEKLLSEDIELITKRQKDYEALNTGSINSIKEKKAALAQLKAEYEDLSDAERETASGQSLNQQIKDLKVEIASLNPERIAKVKDGIKGAYTELSQLKNQIASGALEGPALAKATARAIELQHEVDNLTKKIKLAASNTSGIDALAQGVRGLVGGFTAAAGAVGLFTGSNEAAEKTVAQVTSALAVLNGVQELSNVLAKDSQLNEYLRLQFSKLATTAATEQAVATGAVIVAEEAQAVAATGAATAQKGLNAAMAANPAGILLVALTAIIGAVQLLSTKTEDAAEKQKALNDALLESQRLSAEISRLYIDQANQRQIQPLKDRVEALKNANASEEQILNAEIALSAKRKELASAPVTSAGKSIVDELTKATSESLDDLNHLAAQIEQYNDDIAHISDKSDKKKKEQLEKERAELQSDYNAKSDNYNRNIASLKEFHESELALDQQQAALRKHSYEQQLKDSVAFWETRVEQAKKGSEEELKARNGLADAEARQSLSDPNLTAGQQAKINADRKKAQADANRDFLLAFIDQQKSLVEAQLAAAKQGSYAELKLRIDALNVAAQTEIVNAQGNAAKIKEIVAKNEKEIAELRKQYSFEVAKNDLDARISNTNTMLAQAEEGGQQELNLRKQLNSQKEALDELSAQNTINDTITLNAKLLELKAQLIKDNEKLDDAYIDNYVNKQIKSFEQAAESQKAGNNSIINNRFSSSSDVFNAQQSNFEIDLAAQHKALAETRIAMSDLNISQTEYNKLKDKEFEIKKKIVALDEGKYQNASKKQIDDLKRVGAGILSVSSSLQSLASALADANPALADTISTLGDLGNVAGNAVNAVASFKEGNVFGGISSAVSAIGGLFSIGAKAKESERKAQAEIKAYQDALIIGEIQYNELLRDRVRSQEDIGKLTNQELKDRQAMLELQKQQAQADYDRLLKQIQDTGQQITGEHTEKYGGFLGIGKKTKVVQDLAGLSGTDYDQLEKLFTEGKLDDATKAWFSELQQVHDELDAIGESAQAAQTELNQRYTGTTADSILDGIIQGFQNGLHSAADFADNFQDLMKNAVLNALKYQTLQKPLEDFYNQFANLSGSGDVLTSDEISQLQQLYNDIINKAGKQFENLQSITGLNLNSSGNSGGSALSGAIKGITEQQADLLAGQFGGLRLTAIQQLNVATDSLKSLNLIVDNTARLINIERIMRDQQLNGIKVR